MSRMLTQLEGGALSKRPPMEPALREELSSRVLDAATHVLGDGLLAAVGKGSAYKGDFVPYYSDFDIHLFVDSTRVPMIDGRTPALRPAVAFQAAMGAIDPESYGVNSIQVFWVDGRNYPEDWTPPLPGTYWLIYGELPDELRLPSEESMRQKAIQFFPWARKQARALIGRFLDKPNHAIAPLVRLLGTHLKPAAYQGAILLGANPYDVWCKPLAEVVAQVERTWLPQQGVTRFFREVWEWERVRHDPPRLRTLFKLGVETTEALCDAVEARP